MSVILSSSLSPKSVAADLVVLTDESTLVIPSYPLGAQGGGTLM